MYIICISLSTFASLWSEDVRGISCFIHLVPEDIKATFNCVTSPRFHIQVCHLKCAN